VPPTLESERARGLAAALGLRELVIEDIDVEVGAVPVASYPERVRPTALVHLAGRGSIGTGESVAWSEAAQEDFRLRAIGMPRGRWLLRPWATVIADTGASPYTRAALEAAAIDLALKQGAITIFELASATPAPVRYVVSCPVGPDPSALEGPPVELKLDAEPAWSDGVYRALAARGGIAVLDFKGSVADYERAHRALPAAWIEDPVGKGASWSESLRARLSVDATLTAASMLDALHFVPGAVNVKPARMGGVFEALETIARASERGMEVYLGGMFEVGIGRRQLWALAAMLCPEGPNDVAPIGIAGLPPPRPPRLEVDGRTPGFGAEG
jgi:L-alanine-DL-glutamate epimerase-like enolase superfamily enzyme